ncbi:MAG: hypothetical protein LIO85_09725 [Rikenellaceae bacterium]|nr:hypothetical protein [Rikenellaceae bacterium]
MPIKARYNGTTRISGPRRRTGTRITTALLSVVTLTALPCSCIGEEPEPAGEETVTVKVQSVATGTRAESAAVTDGQAAVLNDGLLIFSLTDGTVKRVFRVAPGITGGNVIGIDDITSDEGVTVKDIDEGCTTVDFFGNIPSGVTAPDEESDISLFRAATQPVTALADGSGGVEKVGLYGRGSISTGSPRRAEFTAAPIGARLEIEKFERDPNVIRTFEIDGIFINNFYHRATMTGSGDSGDIIYYGPTNLFQENGEGYYATVYKGTLFDYDAAVHLGYFTGNDYSTLTPGTVWAYNVFPGEVPHIVVRLSNVEAEPQYLIDKGYATDPFQERDSWYITVTGLRYQNQLLPALRGGEAYTMSITVGENLSTIPEPGDDDAEVDVKVNIVSWVPVDNPTGLPHLPW